MYKEKATSMFLLCQCLNAQLESHHLLFTSETEMEERGEEEEEGQTE